MLAQLTIVRHIDALHVLGNLFGLVVFAPRVARAVGWLRCFALALIAGELANRAAALLVERPVIGASAGVLALVGAWLVLFRHDRNSCSGVALLLVVQAVFAAAALDFGGVAWGAHLIGAALGMGLACLVRPVRNRNTVTFTN